VGGGGDGWGSSGSSAENDSLARFGACGSGWELPVSKDVHPAARKAGAGEGVVVLVLLISELARGRAARGGAGEDAEGTVAQLDRGCTGLATAAQPDC